MRRLRLASLESRFSTAEELEGFSWGLGAPHKSQAGLCADFASALLISLLLTAVYCCLLLLQAFRSIDDGHRAVRASTALEAA